jgi:hypothetical protein
MTGPSEAWRRALLRCLNSGAGAGTRKWGWHKEEGKGEGWGIAGECRRSRVAALG